MAAAPSHKEKISASNEFKVPQRFYEREVPSVKDVVIALVVEVTDTAAYVDLLEYENKRGMIPFSELSKRRIRSISNHIKVGKQEALSVMRIDETYIDLSKKDVSEAEKTESSDRFFKAKSVVTLMRHLAAELGRPVNEMMQTIAWPLDKHPKYRCAYDAFRGCMSEGMDDVLGPLGLDATVRSALESLIKIKMKSQVLSFRADISATCFTEHGIDGVKQALIAGRAVGELEPKLPVTITVVAPPQYLIQCHTDNKELGMGKMHAVLDTIQKKITEVGGELLVENGPQSSDGDDKAGAAGGQQVEAAPAASAAGDDEEGDD